MFKTKITYSNNNIPLNLREEIKRTNAFTFIELISVISILIILWAISIISYEKSIVDARNSTRLNDMWNLKMSLKNHKLKNWSYPVPGNFFDITNSWVIIKQWFLNENVYTQEIIKKPTDPLVKTRYYTYSITNNKLFFQIAMSLEDNLSKNDYDMRAYVDGDYQSLNIDFIPSIVFATGSGWSIQTLSWASIVDKWTFNLPYNEDGNIVKNANSLNQILQENWIYIPTFYWFYSCQEIYENGASMWSWTYKILDSNWVVTSTWC